MNGPIVSDYHNGLETKENQNLAETKKQNNPRNVKHRTFQNPDHY